MEDSGTETELETVVPDLSSSTVKPCPSDKGIETSNPVCVRRLDDSIYY